MSLLRQTAGVSPSCSTTRLTTPVIDGRDYVGAGDCLCTGIHQCALAHHDRLDIDELLDAVV
jgi:hypothetical protein